MRIPKRTMNLTETFLGLPGFLMIFLNILLDDRQPVIKIFLAIVAIGIILFYLYRYYRKVNLRILTVLFTAFQIVLLILIAKYFLRAIRNPHPDQNSLNFLYVSFFQFILLLIAALPVVTRVYQHSLCGFLSKLGGKAATLYILALILFASLITLYSPLTVYFSSWEELNLSSMNLAGWLLSYFFALTISGIFLYRLIPGEIRVILVTTAVVAAAVFWTYTYLIPGDFGHMDNFQLSEPGSLLHPNRLHQILEVFCLILGVSALIFLLIRFPGKVLAGLVILNLMSFGQFATNVIGSKAINRNTKNMAMGRDEVLPPYARELLSFSDEQNVLVIMLDMFSGGTIPAILENNPDISDGLDGFTWFADSLAVSDNTYASLPAMVGGDLFKPEAEGRGEETKLVEKYAAAFQYFPEFFDSAEWALAYVDPPYRNLTDLESDSTILIGHSIDFLKYRQSIASAESHDVSISTAEYSRIFAVVGLFKGSPFIFKPKIYYGSSWLKTNSGNVKVKHAVENLALLESLDELSTVTSDRKTFKYLGSLFTHLPWSVDENGQISKNTVQSISSHIYYPDEDALLINPILPYYTDVKTLNILIEWFDWMRREKIYDKTRIVIVSDHGYSGVDLMTEDDFKVIRNAQGKILEGTARTHALLLFKDFGEIGSLRTSDLLMTNADTAALATGGLGSLQNKDFSKDRIVNLTPHRPEDNGEYSYTIRARFAVNGSMFEQDNWKDITSQE